MTNYFTRTLLLVVLVFSPLNNALAETIAQLINDGELQLNSKIAKHDEHIVGQPFTIVIEVATNRWFARGTSIEVFSLANTVIIPHETAINGNKRINGATWVTQTREIDVYPAKEGSLQLPEIQVNISVNNEKHGVIEGFATTEKQVITVALPSALKDIDHYVVSPKFTLDIDVNFDEETPYAVGDAVSQTITLIAADTPGMMIPPVVFPQIEGLSIYQKPSQVFDKNNRGNIVGTRIEAYTFIFEQPGNYQFEQQIIYWWDSHNEQLTELIIPASKWTVSGKSLSQVEYSKWFVSLLTKSVFYLCISLLVVAWLVRSLYRYKLSLKQFYQKVSQQQKRHAAKDFIKAIKEQNYSLASQKLYNYSLIVNNQQALHPETVVNSAEARQIIERLNRLAFDRQITKTEASLTVNDARNLLKLLSPTSHN